MAHKTEWTSHGHLRRRGRAGNWETTCPYGHVVTVNLKICRPSLSEKFIEMTVEGQAWLGVAKSHEVIAAGLRAPAAANPPAPSPWDACVLLLHCRHLSLCGACEPAVNTCPVCASTKNASLHVLLS
ncbi:hypothetical protein CFC21_083896 [Triticum aestivum]|uniref:Uncharacterized protein n=3 Tax=Triticum TaxID=4564 RepID=A0A9R0Y3X5_TRITD|nr:hypothetical protein CFC21_083896 [Triticum aestivum]VAI47785.1 unnamed protein product [Triticum turgidum subsp. durum]